MPSATTTRAERRGVRAHLSNRTLTPAQTVREASWLPRALAHDVARALVVAQAEEARLA